MYGGLPEDGSARFLQLVEATPLHFRYLADADITGRIVDALLQDDPEGFEPLGAGPAAEPA